MAGTLEAVGNPMEVEREGFGITASLLPLTSWVTRGKPLKQSEPQFPPLSPTCHAFGGGPGNTGVCLAQGWPVVNISLCEGRSFYPSPLLIR